MAAWGIIVGINRYAQSTGLRELNGAVADAADFADWLLDPDGGNIAPEHLFFWTTPKPDPGKCTPRVQAYLGIVPEWPVAGPDFENAPTTGVLVGGISAINRLAVDAGADRLYIFFAGHGAQTQPPTIGEEPQNCFITNDYLPRVENVGLINCDDMKRYLKYQGPLEVVIFLDCCRNELPMRVMRPGVAFSNSVPTGVHQRMCVGRAAQDGFLAFEVPMHPATAERGAFTQLLTYGLREVRNGASLTMPELDKYVTGALIEIVKPKTQVPDFDERPKPPAIVLVTAPPKGVNPTIRIDLSTLDAGSQIELRDEQDVLVQTLDAASDPIALSLPRGAYTLERDGDVLKAFNHVGPGAPDVVV